MLGLAARRKLLASRRLISARAMAGRKVRKRLPPLRQPDSIRVAYYKALRSYVGIMERLVAENVMSNLEAWLAEAEAERGDSLHLDALPARSAARKARAMFATIQKRFNELVDDDALEDLAAEVGERTSNFHREALAKQIETGIGIDIRKLPEPGLGAKIDEFTTQNVGLIKSIDNEYFGSIERRVVGGIVKGERWTELRDDIQKKYFGTGSYADNKAKLIARDQVGKFYGALNKTRQENLGIESYVWRTGEDARVRGDPAGLYPDARPSHYHRNGKTFRWDSPPKADAYDGHPGEPIQCRCHADPNLDDLFASGAAEQSEAEIEADEGGYD